MGLEKIRRFYESRARNYGSTDEEGVRRYSAATSLVSFCAQNLILDVGCKLSVLHHLLVEKGIPHQYFGIDLTATALGASGNSSSHLVQGDVSDGLPFKSGSFTHVFCLELLEHIASPIHLLNEIYRVLRPEGQLLISVPNPYYWAEVYGNLRGFPDTEGHISSFTLQNIKRLLGFASFELRARRGTYIRIPYLGRLKSSPLVDMKPWPFARSVAYLAVKSYEGQVPR